MSVYVGIPQDFLLDRPLQLSLQYKFVACFTSMAYEILYARQVDIWDKIEEVEFSQLFPCQNQKSGVFFLIQKSYINRNIGP
jgi:hypothetical protein